jgi:hypothetical protein
MLVSTAGVIFYLSFCPEEYSGGAETLGKAAKEVVLLL